MADDATPNHCKMYVLLEQDADGYPPLPAEALLVRRTGDTGIVDTIPFYVRGVAPGDQVAVRDEDGACWFERVLAPGGASVLRVFAPDPSGAPALHDALRALGCHTSLDARLWMIACEIPAQVKAAPVLRWLLEGNEKGQLDFEEGVLRHALG